MNCFPRRVRFLASFQMQTTLNSTILQDIAKLVKIEIQLIQIVVGWYTLK